MRYRNLNILKNKDSIIRKKEKEVQRKEKEKKRKQQASFMLSVFCTAASFTVETIFH
jgi:uncharacterized Rmd1/YagE family protein